MFTGPGRLRGSLDEGYLSSSSIATCQALFSCHPVNDHSASFVHSTRAVLVTEIHPRHIQSIHPHGELSVDSRGSCLDPSDIRHSWRDTLGNGSEQSA